MEHIQGDNYWAYKMDSSNHAKEGEGVPEMLQRIQKEKKEKDKSLMERIINYLIGGML